MLYYSLVIHLRYERDTRMLDRSRKKKVYSKKIKRLRRGIVITVVAACLIPTCICVILSVRYDRSS